jgi:hypothetical protein
MAAVIDQTELARRYTAGLLLEAIRANQPRMQVLASKQGQHTEAIRVATKVTSTYNAGVSLWLAMHHALHGNDRECRILMQQFAELQAAEYAEGFEP